jgi:hypothetical protein
MRQLQTLKGVMVHGFMSLQPARSLFHKRKMLHQYLTNLFNYTQRSTSMYRSVRFISLALILVAVVTSMVIGQELVQFKIPITLQSGAIPGRTDTLFIGVHGDGPNPPGTVVDNTYGPDGDLLTFGVWKETAYPSDGMAWDMTTKFVQIPFRTALPPEGFYGTGHRPNDFRGYSNPLQVDTFQINVYGDNVTAQVSAGSVTLGWPAGILNYADRFELKIKVGVTGNNYTTLVANLPNTAGTYVDENLAGNNNIKYLLIKYGAKQPPPGPFCNVASTLDFGSVTSEVSTRTLTVSNSGDQNDLVISAINVTGGFVVTPAAPITVAKQGGTATLTVQFTAGAAGTTTGNIELIHNGVAPTVAPTNVAVSATVVDPAIVAAPATIAFGTVSHPDTRTQIVNLTNASPLRAVTGVSFGVTTGFTVAPLTIATIAPGATVPVTVTFTTQGTGGTQNGPIVVNSNAPVVNIAVSGTSQIQGGTLQFSSALDTVLDNSYNGTGDANGGSAVDGYYTQTIKLTGYSGVALKSVQFTIVTNGKVIGYLLKKTPALMNWSLSTKVMRGTVEADGSSKDSINVVLWAVAPGDQINPTPSIDLLTFGYDVVNINTDIATTSMDLKYILGAQAGTFLDAYLNKPSQSYTQNIVIKNRINRGDVNNDDRVDILDLLMIVDHITGKAPLTGANFIAADVAPWPNGDGQVNVLDLAQLQSIILNNAYPDGLPLLGAKLVLAQLSKDAAQENAFTLYVDKNVVTLVGTGTSYRGCQVKVENLNSAVVASGNELSGAASGFQNGTLTILGKTTETKSGTFAIATYKVNCVVGRVSFGSEIIWVDGAGRSASYKTNIVYGKAPVELTGIPLTFGLHQNYPNPFNPSTRINISVPELSQVRVVIYNMLGQEIATLVNGELEAGVHAYNWNGMDSNGKAIATGTYIYRMTAGTFVETKKMMFLK